MNYLRLYPRHECISSVSRVRSILNQKGETHSAGKRECSLNIEDKGEAKIKKGGKKEGRWAIALSEED